MKILIIVQDFPCLSETFVLNQITGLLDLGHDVQVYPLGKFEDEIIHEDFIKYNLKARTWIPAKIPDSKIGRLIQAIKFLPSVTGKFGFKSLELFNILTHGINALNLSLFYSSIPFLSNKWKPEIILCHFGNNGLIAAIWEKAGVIDIPFITIIHAHEIAGLSDKQGVKTYNPLISGNHLFLPISDYWKNLLQKWGADIERVKVHRMGVDLNRFVYKKRSIPEAGTIQILTVGRLVEQKGIEYAIKAMAILKKIESRKFNLVVIGGGELEIPLKQLVLDLDLQNEIEFKGPRSQADITEALHKAHLFLLPSVTASNGFKEGIPVAIMEAMAMGLPVISTYHSGIPELITNEISGLLVEEKNEKEIASQIKKITNNSELYADIIQKGRLKIENEYNVATLNKDFITILDKELYYKNS